MGGLKRLIDREGEFRHRGFWDFGLDEQTDTMLYSIAYGVGISKRMQWNIFYSEILILFKTVDCKTEN
jgi:hypothetical protein